MNLKTIFLSFFLTLFYVGFSGGNPFEKGYIVTLNGDTIQGEIKLPMMASASDKVKFKGVDGKIKTIKPRKYLAIGREGGWSYRRAKAGLFGAPKFVPVVLNGELSLLEYITVSKDKYGHEHKSYTYFIQRTKDPASTKKVPLFGFKNFITPYIKDDKILLDKIMNQKLDDCYKIVEEYNNRKNGLINE
jgi:hypothetical protein